MKAISLLAPTTESGSLLAVVNAIRGSWFCRASVLAGSVFLCAIAPPDSGYSGVVAGSTEEFAYAKLLDHTIELQPSKATFRIPQPWVDLYHNDHCKNIHLTRDQLAHVKDADDSEWDGDYSKIVNSVLPFEKCAVHAGGDGWGVEGRVYNDLQMRAYLGTWSVNEIRKLVKKNGYITAKRIYQESQRGMPPEAKQMLDNPKAKEKEFLGEWRHLQITVPLWYDDYGGTGNVDFYVKHFHQETVVLVFMYVSEANQVAFIPRIVSSFRHP